MSYLCLSILRCCIFITSNLAVLVICTTLSDRIVLTKYGKLQGVIKTFPRGDVGTVEMFLGVPFATAPLKDLRYVPPITPNKWSGVKICDHLSPVCPQSFPDLSNNAETLLRMPKRRLNYIKKLKLVLENQSEDCLYMNIYVPQNGK